MAHVKSSIELDAPVDVVHEQWSRFEALPYSPTRSLVKRIRWRAEVLTFEPMERGTRIIVKIEFDPPSTDPKLELRLGAALQSFRSFLARQGTVSFEPAISRAV